MKCFVFTTECSASSEHYVYGVYGDYDFGNSELKAGIGIYRALEYEVSHNEEKKGEYHHVTMKRERGGGLAVEYVDLNLEAFPIH